MTTIQRSPSLKQARATLKALTAEILARKAGIGRSIYEIGIRLARIQQQELWRAGRFFPIGWGRRRTQNKHLPE